MCRLVSAVVVAAFLSACALEVVEERPPVEVAPDLRAAPAELPAPETEASETVRLQRAPSDAPRSLSESRSLVVQPPADGVGVALELEPGWNAVGLTALVAVPSCGWWPIASATAVGANGQASFTFLPREDVGLGFTEAQLFFFVDHDGDQLCDEGKGDEVFTAPLGQVTAGAQVQVALGQLAPSPYSCSLFSYLP